MVLEVGDVQLKASIDRDSLKGDLDGIKGDAESAFSGIESRASEMGGKIASAFSAIGISIGTALSIGASFNAIADQETQLDDLGRAAHLTGDALQEVADSNRDLSMESGQTRDSLNQVSTELGKIAKSPKDIDALTKSVSDFADINRVANTDVAGLDVKIGQVWGEGVPGITKLNEAATGLQSAIGAAADKTLDFTGKWGAYLKQMGTSDTQTAAFGATLNAVGLDGDSAMSEIQRGVAGLATKLGTLETAADKTSKTTKKGVTDVSAATVQAQQELEGITKTFGESGDQIQKDFDTDFTGTFMKLSEKLAASAGDMSAYNESVKLFGKQMTDAMIKAGGAADVWNTALATVNNTAGNTATTQSLLSQRAEELWHKVDQLKQITADLALNLGAKLEPAIGTVLDKVISFGMAIDKIFGGSQNLGQTLQTIFSQFSNMGGLEKFAVVATGITTVLVAIGALTPIVTLLGGAFMAFLSPVTIGIAIIAGIASAFVDWKAAGEDLNGVITFLSDAVTTLWGDLSSGDYSKAFRDLSSDAKTAYDALAIATKEAAQSIWNYFSQIDFKGAITTGINTLINYLNIVWTTGLNIASYIYNSIKNIDWGAIAGDIQTGLSSAMSAIGNILGSPDVTGLVDSIKAAFSNLNIPNIWGGLTSGLSTLSTDVQAAFSKIPWSTITSTISSAFSAGLADLTGLGQTIYDDLNNVHWATLGASIGSTLGGAVQTGVAILSSLGDTIKGYVNNTDWAGTGTSIGDKIKDAIGAVSGWADRAQQGFLIGWDDTGTKVANMIKNGIDTVTNWYESIKKSISDWVNSDAPGQLGKDLGNFLIKGVQNAWSALTGGAGDAAGLWGTIKSVLTEAETWITIGAEGAGKFLQGFTNSILTGLAKAVGDAILAGLAAAFTTINSSIQADFAAVGVNVNPFGNTIAAIRAQQAANTTPVLNPNTGKTEEVPTGASYTSSGKLDYSGVPDGTVVSQGGVMGFINNGQWYAGTPPTETTTPTATTVPTTTTTTTTAATTPSGIDANAFVLQQIQSLGHLTGSLTNDQINTLAQTAVQQGYTANDIIAALNRNIPNYNDVSAAFSPDQAATFLTDFTAAQDKANQAETANYTTNLAAAKANSDAINANDKKTSDDVNTSTNATASKIANMMTGVTTTNSTTAKADNVAQQQAADYAATAIKLGAEVGGKFTTDAGQAVSIGLDSSGKAIADIGEGAKANAVSGGQTLLANTTTGGSKILDAATQGSAKTISSGNTFQDSINAGATTAMNAISKMSDPAQKLIAAGQYVASALVSAGQSLLTMARSAGNGVTNYQNTQALPSWLGSAFAEGTIANKPTPGIFGESGPEALVPLADKKSGWNILKKILPNFGIKVFDEGGVVGSAATPNVPTSTSVDLTLTWDVGKLVATTEQQLTDLKNFFATTWSIIESEGVTAWMTLNTLIQPLVTQLKTTMITSMSSLQNQALASWTALNTGILAIVTALWPTIQPKVIAVHDGIVNSFSEVNSLVTSQMDQMQANVLAELQAIVDGSTPKFTTLNDEITTMNTNVTTVNTSLQALVTLINQLNTMSINVSGSVSMGGGSGGGDMADITAGSSGGSSTQVNGAINGGAGGFTDVTCTGETVIVNPLKYTSPSGQTTYINPETYIDNGGISGAQGGGVNGSDWGGGVGYTGDYGLPSGLQGYAEGGISLGPQVAPVSEGGHPELHLPLTPANVQQYLSGALAPQNGNGGEGDEVHIYIGTEEVTNMVLKRTMRRMKAKGAKFPS